MGATDARFYWYPDKAGSLEEVDLGEGLSDLQLNWQRFQTTSEAADGRVYTTDTGGLVSVRIVLERFTSVDTFAALTAMLIHLKRGGYVGFSENHTKAWAIFANNPQLRGDSTMRGTGATFYNASPTLVADDYLVISSNVPHSLFEMNKVSTFAAQFVTLDSGIKYSHRSTPVMVRWHGFYPLLRMPADQRDQAGISQDHRQNFTLDLTLEEDPAGIASLALLGDSGLRGSTGQGQSPEELLEAAGYAGSLTQGLGGSGTVSL